MTDEELYQLRYRLRETSSQALSLASQVEALGREVRRLSGQIDDVLLDAKPRTRRWWQRSRQNLGSRRG